VIQETSWSIKEKWIIRTQRMNSGSRCSDIDLNLKEDLIRKISYLVFPKKREIFECFPFLQRKRFWERIRDFSESIRNSIRSPINFSFPDEFWLKHNKGQHIFFHTKGKMKPSSQFHKINFLSKSFNTNLFFKKCSPKTFTKPVHPYYLTFLAIIKSFSKTKGTSSNQQGGGFLPSNAFIFRGKISHKNIQ